MPRQLNAVPPPDVHATKATKYDTSIFKPDSDRVVVVMHLGEPVLARWSEEHQWFVPPQKPNTLIAGTYWCECPIQPD